MELTQYRAARRRDYSSEGVGIARKDGEKLDLGLRTSATKFEQELALLKLPKDTEALLNVLINGRARSNREKYQMACAYLELTSKKRGKFWEKWGCKTLDELLIDKLGLPLDGTFARWLHVAKMFTLTTCEVVGFHMLLEMIQIVDMQHTVLGTPKDGLLEAKKAAYRGIFKWYASHNDCFDKQMFRNSVDDYLEKTYPAPKQPKQKKGKRTTKQTVVEDVSEDVQQSAPHADTDLRTYHVTCSGCERLEAERDAWKKWALANAEVITTELGAERLPPRPKGI
jgi:hypothetical protein